MAAFGSPRAALGADEGVDWDRVRGEEQVRKHGALRTGSRIILGPPDPDNWNPEQNRYVGATTRVIELAEYPDARGCYGVRVQVDGGLYFWRVRNLSGQGLRSGEYLDCVKIEGTEIPLCVIPLTNSVSLLARPALEAEPVDVVPLFRLEEGDRTWYVPRHLYVHKARDGHLEVMESDFGSRETLGWLREADTVAWPTRQGYVVNRGRNPREQILGYARLEDWGREERAVYRENLQAHLTIDPNITSMCDGLLLQRRMVRGLPAVQCALTPEYDEARRIVWLPFDARSEALQPHVLMTEFDLLELSAMFAYLYAACEQGYVDQIRQAVEEEWDLEAKAMTGTKKRVQNYARFYREVQQIYPALSRRLALPPGRTTEREFREIGERAVLTQAKVQRLIDEMQRDGRSWGWVKVADL